MVLSFPRHMWREMERGRDTNGSPKGMESEADLERGTLDQWRSWRNHLVRSRLQDESARLALAIADARIARMTEKRSG